MFHYSNRLILLLFILTPIIVKTKRTTRYSPGKGKGRTTPKKWWKTLPRKLPFPIPLEPIKNFFGLSKKNSELDDTLTLLKSIFDFCEKNKAILEGYVVFGLLLANVHLKPVMNSYKFNKLSNSQQDKIKQMVAKSNEIQKSFLEDTGKNHDAKSNDLVMNESKWVKRLPVLNKNLLNETVLSTSKFTKVSDWNTYSYAVNDFSNIEDSKADDCFNSISNNPYNNAVGVMKCTTSQNCERYISNTSGFGYNLLNRLVVLQIAYFGSGCSIFSNQVDMELKNSICATLYLEADFISKNKYGEPILLIAIISFCAMEGHAQFLRSDWLKEIQKFKTKEGCFALKKSKRQDFFWRSSDPKPIELLINVVTNIRDVNWKQKDEGTRSNLAGICHSTFTGLSISAFAASVRYAIESK